MLLLLTSAISKQRAPLWRLLISSGFGGGCATLYLLIHPNLAYAFLFKIAISIFIVLIAFGYRSFYAMLRTLLLFYLSCFVVGGALYAFNSHYSSVYLSWSLILCGLPIAWIYSKLSFRMMESSQLISSYFAELRFKILGREVNCTGLIDTGNQLKDPVTGTPVILIELKSVAEFLPKSLIRAFRREDTAILSSLEELDPEFQARVRIIPYKAIGDANKMLIAIKPDEANLYYGKSWNKIEKVLIGIEVGLISTDATYQAIIHPACLTAFNISNI